MPYRNIGQAALMGNIYDAFLTNRYGKEEAALERWKERQRMKATLPPITVNTEDPELAKLRRKTEKAALEAKLAKFKRAKRKEYRDYYNDTETKEIKDSNADYDEYDYIAGILEGYSPTPTNDTGADTNDIATYRTPEGELLMTNQPSYADIQEYTPTEI